MTLAFGLLGSGEFEPWQGEVDRWLIDRSVNPGGPVLILPTAAAHEGDEMFDHWANKGLDHYRSAGIPAEVVPLKTREDAARPELVGRLEGASAVFFSGGNPKVLAAKLSKTPFLAELLRVMKEGVPYAGCSAGVACLGPTAPDSDAMEIDESVMEHPGLDLFGDTSFGPHWDELDTFVPGLTDLIVRWTPPGWLLFAIDTNTAAAGDGERWTVMGSGKVHLHWAGEWEHYGAGESFSRSLPLGSAWV
jgi:cyanophycinase-like exopeptidase